MSSIQKTASGYRAQVSVKVRGQPAPVRDSATFRTKREADAWAARRDSEIRADADKTPGEKYTLAEALTKYRLEVSPEKRGRRWEDLRIDAFLRDPLFPAKLPMKDVTPEKLGLWRDSRLRVVSAGTVLREIGLVSAVYEAARLEWRWVSANPIRDIRKPRAPDHREVVITRAQIKSMLRVMGYSPRLPIRTVAQSVAVCFLVALRTGMRAGELCGLPWARVFGDYAVLPVTKTVPRHVPITAKAGRLIERMRGYDPVLVFGLKANSLDANFRKYRDRAGLSGITFHDSRHTAATWMSRKIDVLDLCRAFGWSKTSQALTYYSPSASSIAALLNKR